MALSAEMPRFLKYCVSSSSLNFSEDNCPASAASNKSSDKPLRLSSSVDLRFVHASSNEVIDGVADSVAFVVSVITSVYANLNLGHMAH